MGRIAKAVRQESVGRGRRRTPTTTHAQAAIAPPPSGRLDRCEICSEAGDNRMSKHGALAGRKRREPCA